MAAKTATFRRRNRVVGVADALAEALDPMLKKRGFASQDIISHWADMAPPPYNHVAMPDKLSWPRGERRAEGAILYLRCLPGHGLTIAHEGPSIAAAVNRYYGYVLVAQIRLSAEPFSPGSAKKSLDKPMVAPATHAKIAAQVEGVADEGIREALQELGLALAGKTKKQG